MDSWQERSLFGSRRIPPGSVPARRQERTHSALCAVFAETFALGDPDGSFRGPTAARRVLASVSISGEENS